jgi:hypothetical protein
VACSERENKITGGIASGIYGGTTKPHTLKNMASPEKCLPNMASPSIQYLEGLAQITKGLYLSLFSCNDPPASATVGNEAITSAFRYKQRFRDVLSHEDDSAMSWEAVLKEWVTAVRDSFIVSAHFRIN